jgi:hypothetical protein
MSHLRLLSRLPVAVLLAAPLAAQGFMTIPWDSPAATVSQTIGVTEVTLSTSRPAVKGRTIWGKVVPWNEVWRAGANRNTTIAFGDDVTVEGKALPAGTYGLHMIPRQAGNWTVIFSHDAGAWGSYHYDEQRDALRVDVKPAEAPFTEWLSFEFTDLADDHATLQLRWEKLAVPVKLATDTHAHVLAHAREDFLQGRSGFYWQSWNAVAKYCLDNQTHLEDGLGFAQRFVAMQPGFGNLWTQAGLLAALGRPDEAAPLREKALALAGETDINTLGYEYLQGGKLDEAIAAFRKNVEKYPQSWNVYDSLAEAFAMKGDKTQAIELYGKALSMVQDPANKSRIESELNRLRG